MDSRVADRNSQRFQSPLPPTVDAGFFFLEEETQMIHDPFDDPGLEVAWGPALHDDTVPGRLVRFPRASIDSESDDLPNECKEDRDGSCA